MIESLYWTIQSTFIINMQLFTYYLKLRIKIRKNLYIKFL